MRGSDNPLTRGQEECTHDCAVLFSPPSSSLKKRRVHGEWGMTPAKSAASINCWHIPLQSWRSKGMDGLIMEDALVAGLGQSFPALTALIKSGCNINGPWISLIAPAPGLPSRHGWRWQMRLMSCRSYYIGLEQLQPCFWWVWLYKALMRRLCLKACECTRKRTQSIEEIEKQSLIVLEHQPVVRTNKNCKTT